MNLDPNPEFGQIWIRIQIRIGIQINFKNFFLTTGIRKKGHQKKFLVREVSNGNFFFNLTPLASNLSYFSGSVFGIQIRIHKVPEYGSKLDPDPQHLCHNKFIV